MQELSIVVTAEGENSRTYQFREFPVRIGRSPECHLSICHEAVPRELCIAWLENRGRTVRVEERPHLTNPLLQHQRLVDGGISGPRIDVSVGPVGLTFEPSASRKDPTINIGKLNSARTVIIGIIGLVLVLIALTTQLNTVGSRSLDGYTLLPPHPICRIPEDTCDDALVCRERIRLFASRAQEMLSRPGDDPGVQIHAAMLLKRAVQLGQAADDPEIRVITNAAKIAEENVVVAYQRDALALKQILEKSTSNQEAVASMASRLSNYLAFCDGPGRQWLHRLVTHTDHRKE
ncbi:MAG: hypothetical protein QNJ97_12725 [Myxococcota bacterium]|nr:hypothetical protein [Myxococcota bacterium]